MRATKALINLKKLEDNAKFLQTKAQGREMMGIIKADAYGHGALDALKTLQRLGWKYFGVATIEEALELREEDAQIDILILGTTSPEDFSLCARKNLSYAVHDYASLLAARATEVPGKIHIKVDTGMHRVGFSPEALEELTDELRALQPVGIFTHLARADEEDKSSAHHQIACFHQTVERLKDKGITFEWVHFANSAAILEMDLSFSNIVRAGIALYGLSPGMPHPELQPVMSWRSKILAIREIESGEGVSYGHQFIAKDFRRIATVPIGYADGYKRQMSGQIQAWIDEKECPQVGRITMDQTMFDVTDTKAQVGDEVELMGEHIPCERLASAAKTINYEIVTTLGKRVRKVIL